MSWAWGRERLCSSLLPTWRETQTLSKSLLLLSVCKALCDGEHVRSALVCPLQSPHPQDAVVAEDQAYHEDPGQVRHQARHHGTCRHGARDQEGGTCWAVDLQNLYLCFERFSLLDLDLLHLSVLTWCLVQCTCFLHSLTCEFALTINMRQNKTFSIHLLSLAHILKDDPTGSHAEIRPTDSD